MKKMIRLVTYLIISLPLAVLADNPQKEIIEKRVIVKTTGGADETQLSKVLEWTESTSGENVEVFITVDDDGEVIPREFHKVIAGRGMAHAMAFTDSMRTPHPRPHRVHHSGKLMSQEAAGCVLKYISKVNSDAAAHLLKEACQSLNPHKPASDK
ncbi:MAG: hypothetical protein ACI9FB_002547 [Candidatus Azotimanducaceae bacterium]|jgi:hypothetical protein